MDSPSEADGLSGGVEMGMQVGINYPWFDNSFGDNLFNPRTAEDFEQTLERLVPSGVSVVRVWLLCQLHRYEQLRSSEGKRAFDTFERLLTACANRGVQMIPSLVCHDAFGDPARAPGNGGRASLLRDDALGVRLFDEALEPMLERSRRYEDHVHSWELMNEPSWNLCGVSRWSHRARARGVSKAQLRRFLEAGLERIETAGFASTVGHARAADLGALPTGSRPQFHWYGLPQLRLPTHAATGAFVGEISSSAANWLGRPPGTSRAGIRQWFREATTMPWPELFGADLRDDRTAVLARLSALERKGYGLALLWPSLTTGPGWAKYSSGAREALEQFCR